MQVNKRFITGNLGKDPEVFPNETNGTVMLLFSTAQTRRFKKSDGSYGEITEWTDHKWFLRKEAYQRIESRLIRGAHVYVEGRHDQIKREQPDGSHRTYHEIYVFELQFISKPRQQNNDGDGGSDSDNDGKSGTPGKDDVNRDNFQPSKW